MSRPKPPVFDGRIMLAAKKGDFAGIAKVLETVEMQRRRPGHDMFWRLEKAEDDKQGKVVLTYNYVQLLRRQEWLEKT